MSECVRAGRGDGETGVPGRRKGGPSGSRSRASRGEPGRHGVLPDVVVVRKAKMNPSAGSRCSSPIPTHSGWEARVPPPRSPQSPSRVLTPGRVIQTPRSAVFRAGEGRAVGSEGGACEEELGPGPADFGGSSAPQPLLS